jgi:hypothetical protein
MLTEVSCGSIKEVVNSQEILDSALYLMHKAIPLRKGIPEAVIVSTSDLDHDWQSAAYDVEEHQMRFHEELCINEAMHFLIHEYAHAREIEIQGKFARVIYRAEQALDWIFRVVCRMGEAERDRRMYSLTHGILWGYCFQKCHKAACNSCIGEEGDALEKAMEEANQKLVETP